MALLGEVRVRRARVGGVKMCRHRPRIARNGQGSVMDGLVVHVESAFSLERGHQW